ncbi:MAG: rod shape-determining protein MreC [Bdellovibrionota bacterium]
MNKKFKRLLLVFLVIYFLMQFIALGFSKKDNPAFHEKLIVGITAPMQWLVYSTYKSIHDVIAGYIFLVRLKKENFELKHQVSILRDDLVRMKEIEYENHRLKKIFNIKPDPSYRRIVAQRVAYGSSRFEQTVRVQKGRKHGVNKGYPVLNSDGIIGQVVEVYHGYSDILLVTDPTHSIDVIIQRSRDNGMLKGSAYNQLQFQFLSKESDVFEGDVVISSGLDGIYPKGFPIGKVSAVGVRGTGLFLDATVKPFVDFKDIEEVVILVPNVSEKDQQ